MKLNNVSPLGIRLILSPEDALSLRPPGAPVCITCVAGCIHVTQTGDPEDHVLEPGAIFRSARKGKIVVTSFRCSTLEARTYTESKLSAWPASAPPTTMIQGRTFQAESSRNAVRASAKSAGLTMALVHTGVYKAARSIPTTEALTPESAD